jgi:hypothetical protein
MVLGLAATRTTPTRTPRRTLWLAAAGVAVLAVAAVVVALVSSSGTSVTPLPPLYPGRVGPQTMFTAGSIATDTPANLQELKALGVDRVHIYMHWADIAPDPTSRTKPSFDASDPSAYPAGGWAPYDAVIRDLSSLHMGVDLDLIAPPPNWASGKGAPHPAKQPFWHPSAADFAPFVRAVATRYDGHYTPPGASRPLPRVSFWSIWNEPNLGIEIAPEAIDHSQIEVAPKYYRGLVDAAWGAFQATGHGHDTILIGEVAPAGETTGVGPGNFNSMAPLRFLRALYCVGSNYEPLRGLAATERGCPATAAESDQFAAQNPGLFKASGFADHPYPQGLPPNRVTPDEPDFAELAAVGKLEGVLDRMQRVYGSSTKFPIWSTEFGYQTTPPDPEAGTVSPQVAAYYLNWSEYLTWLDPRQKSYDQYLLQDAPNGYFATGLVSANGVPKPGYYAFRMPLYLPVTETAKGHPLDVWGGVRPAPSAAQATHKLQVVQIQFRAGDSGGFRTLRTLPITDRYGYFDVRQTFPSSGQVRLAWAAPHAGTDFSRTVDITLN